MIVYNDNSDIINRIYTEYPEESNLYDFYNEAEIGSGGHLKVAILDVDGFVKANDFQQITNPLLFLRENFPTPDGLLSNEIFGITKEERANIYGYIGLNGTFMDPLCYKTWASLDSKIRNIVHETKKYSINENGELIEDENGKTGIDFLKKNFDKIKIRRTDSKKRDNKIKFLLANKNVMFIDKYMVIPPYYRDANSTKGHASVEGINKLYISLIMATNALKETAEYGFSMEGAQKGRIQEIILNIYDFFCGNNNSAVDGEGAGLARKTGIIRRAVLSKTTDYGSRNVISAPFLRVEHQEDMMVDLEHSALPLATTLTTFYPFILFNIKRMFDDWFSGVNPIEYIDKNGKLTNVRVYEPYIQFSDDRIKEELKRFLHGYSNRLIPIEVEVEDMDGVKLKNKVSMRFKGFSRKTAEDDIVDEDNIVTRRMTWVDVFYMAAVEATKDKMVLLTRFPINNQSAQLVTVDEKIYLIAGNC